MNPSDFLNQAVTGAMSTRRIPIPKGDYPAIIKELGHRTMDSKEKPGEVIHIMDVIWAIDDANVKEVTGLSTPTAKQSLFLDLTPEGTLDYSTGKNVGLGRLREAVGQNDPNTEWRPSMLVGAAGVIGIEHAPGKDPQDVFANVAKVGKIA